MNRITGWWWVAVIAVGVLVVCAAAALAANGRDHTGETVRASQWAGDVCATVGTWQGTMQVLRDEIEHNNYGSRMDDGSSGDAVEGNLTVRGAITRAIRSTDDVLQEGLKRAGIPDTSHGKAAVGLLRLWATRTNVELRAIRHDLKHDPANVEASYAALAQATAILQQSLSMATRTFDVIGQTDTELGDAISGSANCGRLTEELS